MARPRDFYADLGVARTASQEEVQRAGRRRSGASASRTCSATSAAGREDLYLIVAIGPDARYRVEGRDIAMRLPLAPWEAALGTTVP
jgi:DnaJ-class molecular chaperone